MTLSGPDFISLQVDDLDRAERFYTEVIGLTRAEKKPEAVVFATEPIPFAVRLPLTPLPEPSKRAQGVSLWFLYRRRPRAPHPAQRGGCTHHAATDERSFRTDVYLCRSGRLPYHRT